VSELIDNMYVVGRRAVAESLAAGAPLSKVLLCYGSDDTPLASMRAAAKRAGVQCSVMDRRKFGELEASLGLARNDAQGVIALRAAHVPLDVDALVDMALAKRSDPVLVALDGITDPHNLGAIARSAECSGADGIVLSERFSAPITPVAVKASAGALEHLPTARVQRVSDAIIRLKERGFRAIGTAIPASAAYDDEVYSGPVLLVIGSEGEGLHPRILELCDTVITIPMAGNIESLNASVASGVVLFEIARQRRTHLAGKNKNPLLGEGQGVA